MTADTLTFLYDIADFLLIMINDFSEFLYRKWDLFGIWFTTAELLFGGGLIFALVWNLIKWLNPLN